MGDIRRLSPPGLKEDLEPVEEETKNWKGIIISLLVISTICSFILLSIVILTPKISEQNSGELLKLEDFILHGYDIRRYNGTWISNSEILFRNVNRSICIYDIRTKLTNIILDGSTFRDHDTHEYFLSSDRKTLLLVHDVKKVGTYSRTSRYTLYNLKKTSVTPLVINQSDSQSHQHQFAQWVPNTNLILVVHQNNIYLLDHLSRIKHNITENGRENLIYNGVTDMSYEEHILYSSRAFWLNTYSEGWEILYMTIDATQTDKVPFIYYGKQINNSQFNKDNSHSYVVPYNLNEEELARVGLKKSTNGNAYPEISSFPYPKAGKRMPKMTMHVTKFDQENEIIYKEGIVIPPLGEEQEPILSAEPVWISPGEFGAIWTRRAQDIAIISRCKDYSSEWRCEKIIDLKMLYRPGSLIINSPIFVPKDSDKIFAILPLNEGPSGNFDHIAMISPDQKKHFLTYGSYVVTKIYHYDALRSTIYYAASSPDEPCVRHIYALTHQKNSNQRKNIRCLSCALNYTCQYADAKFAPNGRNFILECLGPDIPSYYLFDTEKEEIIDILDNSTMLRAWTKRRLMPKTRHIVIDSTRQYMIHIQLNIPANVNELDDAKYPLVIETARMPGIQISNFINKVDWSRYLSSRREYVTARIDTRGSAHQGDKNMFSIYKHVGELEVEDLKTALKSLKKLPYIDQSKIAVWGQEYGGYISALFLAQAEETVACGIAISPITSWKNYLAIQSERFMAKPEDNSLDYERMELMKYAHLLKGRTFMIVHGTADKRVNIQHSMQLIKSLTNNAVQFQTQFYPDSGSLETWDIFVRYHFYRAMEDFFAKCFKVEDEEDEDDILPITKVIKGRVRGSK